MLFPVKRWGKGDVDGGVLSESYCFPNYPLEIKTNGEPIRQRRRGNRNLGPFANAKSE